MCTRVTQTAGSLMTALEPEFVQLLTLEGIASEPDGVAAINAFNSAAQLLTSWQPNTAPSANLLEALTDVTTIFDGLPLPDADKALANVISATLIVIVNLVRSKSTPAPSAVAAASLSGVAASPEVIQQIHEDTLEASTNAQVKRLVPNFKRSMFHSPAGNQKKAWNGGVKEVVNVYGEKYAVLKQ